MYTLAGTVLIQSSRNFVRMVIFIKPRSGSQRGHVGSKTRLLGQIIEKHCVRSRGHSFEQKIMKLCQNVNSHKFRSSSKLGHVGPKTRSLNQIMEKLCVHSRVHSLIKRSRNFVKMLILISLGQY